MRKVLAIFGIIFFGVLLYIYLNFFYDRHMLNYNTDENHLTESQIMEGIMDEDNKLEEKVKQLQENPKSISDFNSTVTKSIYKSELTDEELMKVIEFQYKYFDDKLKAINSVDEMFRKTKEELAKYEKAGLIIIGFDSVAPQEVETDKFMSIVKVKYYTNYPETLPPEEDGTVAKQEPNLATISMGYVFRKDGEDDLWKLYGFKQISDFPIVK